MKVSRREWEESEEYDSSLSEEETGSSSSSSRCVGEARRLIRSLASLRVLDSSSAMPESTVKLQDPKQCAKSVNATCSLETGAASAGPIMGVSMLSSAAMEEIW